MFELLEALFHDVFRILNDRGELQASAVRRAVVGLGCLFLTGALCFSLERWFASSTTLSGILSVLAIILVIGAGVATLVLLIQLLLIVIIGRIKRRHSRK
jgi:hypothetical protein